MARLRRRIGLFLLTTLFYIQANEGAGSRVMRDGMGEKQWREEESEPRKGEKLRKRPLGKSTLLKINTVMRIHRVCAE